MILAVNVPLDLVHINRIVDFKLWVINANLGIELHLPRRISHCIRHHHQRYRILDGRLGNFLHHVESVVVKILLLSLDVVVVVPISITKQIAHSQNKISFNVVLVFDLLLLRVR